MSLSASIIGGILSEILPKRTDSSEKNLKVTV